MVATVTSKGQVTVPSAVRRELGLRDGDGLEFSVSRGRAVIRPVKARRSASGILRRFLPPGWKAPTVEEMNEGMARHAAEKFRRAR